MISDAELAQLKANNPCDVIAARLGVRLRKHGTKMVGPCPICSRDRQGKSASRFEATSDGWVCAVCADGGDVIRLIERAEGLDFRSAIAWLGGPGEVDPAIAARRERERTAEKAKREADADAFRLRERGWLYDIWKAALPAPGTPVEDYLRLRRLELPPGVRLRCAPDMPYFHGTESSEDGRQHQRVIHRGPAMVAPIVGPNGHFRGLHFTYLDLTRPKGKAVIVDPDTGEPLPAKKVRGTKAGGVIELTRPVTPRRLIIGEGIETVLSVWLALHKLGRDLADVAFRSAVDLGNFGGRAIETIRHPSEVDARGRPRRVPGPAPDVESTAIMLPDCVEDVVLLGDGDSDAMLTECALRRAAARWETSTRAVRVGWAPPGRDFNDLLVSTEA
jgi:hypothetical protein